ncbi:uncharacterized protein LOC111706750 isoform X2 [Eurytemora carolleeae]|uniref:uncharacterized protein LOC111706750 isoform X2 n=1 Tax=Eurytemora carolleeae TaxID=1294199 RepID=UPI000C767C5C|nr:uncharacterized protein LOC111706750 isoform X2 [Eurytemora carolleeae]|eukprot:XP_023335456.1 uncharacterized protein LOC111706750 isoform X2 [Eurytemora affinis]
MAHKRASISHESGPSKRVNTAPGGNGDSESSRSSVKFINFTKSGGKESYHQTDSREKIPDINLREHIDLRDLEAKQRICKVNPAFEHTELSRIDEQDYPTFLKDRKLSSRSGYICEIRIQEIFFGLGFSVSKPGARDRASENVMRTLRSKEICVVPMQRRWRDKNYPELVLATSIDAKIDIPPFYQPPPGTEAHTRMKNFGQKKLESKRSMLQEKKTNPALGFQNVAHMGPPCSGKPLENFVILLNDENAVCVMNSSAQFCKMSVDYFFEKPSGTSNDFIVTLFIEGQPVADAKAPKKMLKQIVTERALQCLDMFCHIVVTNKELIQNCTTVSRSDIKGNQASTSAAREDGSIGGIGARMMKMMGWTEGGGIGDRFKMKREIIKVDNESMNREGFGSKAIDSDNITREEAEEIVKQYANSDRIDDLVFASELNFDERKEVRYMAKRFNLLEKMIAVPNGRGKRVFMVLSKKIDSDLIIEQLEREGQFGKYQLIKPAGGDARVVSRFLNFQHLRKTQGFPVELQVSNTGRRNQVNWRDNEKSSDDYRQSTTFDKYGNVDTCDESVRFKIENATQCINPGTGWSNSMSNMEGGWNSGSRNYSRLPGLMDNPVFVGGMNNQNRGGGSSAGTNNSGLGRGMNNSGFGRGTHNQGFRSGNNTADMGGGINDYEFRGGMNNSMMGSGMNNSMIGPGMNDPMMGSGMNNPMMRSGMDNPMMGSGMNNPMMRSGMDNPMMGSGMNNPMMESGMNNPMMGSGMNNPLRGSGMNNPMRGSGMNNPMRGSGMNNPMMGSEMNNPMRGSGMNNPMKGFGMNNAGMGSEFGAGPRGRGMSNRGFGRGINQPTFGNHGFGMNYGRR